MACAIDIGDAEDIHPANKADVGERLALWALARNYGKTDLTVSGPLFRQLTIEGQTARIHFDHTDTGLITATKSGRLPATETKGARLERFAIAGNDRQWHWANATIDGDTVTVSSPQVPAPVAVRYAFSSNPAGANLYNRAGLPASPFRTDSW
jgi:sialate O-acetylesterase